MYVLNSSEPYAKIDLYIAKYFENEKKMGMPSIFLAGPSPRSKDVKTWRPEAVNILAELDFRGLVFVPEPFSGTFDIQVAWEWSALSYASKVVFWVPRDLEKMPAFTTNVEFGMFAGTEKIIYGRPEGAPKTRYLDWHYRNRGTSRPEPFTNLRDMLIHTVSVLR